MWMLDFVQGPRRNYRSWPIYHTRDTLSTHITTVKIEKLNIMVFVFLEPMRQTTMASYRRLWWWSIMVMLAWRSWFLNVRGLTPRKIAVWEYIHLVLLMSHHEDNMQNMILLYYLVSEIYMCLRFNVWWKSIILNFDVIVSWPGNCDQACFISYPRVRRHSADDWWACAKIIPRGIRETSEIALTAWQDDRRDQVAESSLLRVETHVVDDVSDYDITPVNPPDDEYVSDGDVEADRDSDDGSE